MTDPVTPTASFMDWIEASHTAAAAVQQSTEGLWEPIAVGSAIIGSLALGLRIARFIPGWGPIVHTIGQKAIDWIAPEKKKAAQRQERVLAQAMQKTARIIETLPVKDEVTEQLKKRIKEAAPAEFHAIFANMKDAWLNEDNEEESKP